MLAYTVVVKKMLFKCCFHTHYTNSISLNLNKNHKDIQDRVFNIHNPDAQWDISEQKNL